MTLEKFKLLCWKNFQLQKRHPIAGFFEVIFPIIIVLIFTFARSNVTSQTYQELTFEKFQPSDYSSCYMLSQKKIARVGISPSNNPALEKLIKSSIGQSFTTEFFENAAALGVFLDRENDTVAGIEFDDNISVS